MRVSFKCTEFVPYTKDSADGSDREGPLLRVHKFSLLK